MFHYDGYPKIKAEKTLDILSSFNVSFDDQENRLMELAAACCSTCDFLYFDKIQDKTQDFHKSFSLTKSLRHDFCFINMANAVELWFEYKFQLNQLIKHDCV